MAISPVPTMSPTSTTSTLGILGGGQLGRMLATAAHELRVRTCVLDNAVCPAAYVTQVFAGDFKKREDVLKMAKQVDVLTVEIEHIDVQALADSGVPVNPAPATLRIIQDKFEQKRHLQQAGVPIGDFCQTQSQLELRDAAKRFGYPLMIKSRRMAYDGRGNFVAQCEEDLQKAITVLTSGQMDGQLQLYAERWVPYERELAVMVVRASDGNVLTYPAVDTIQEDNICHTVLAPATVQYRVRAAAERVAAQAIRSFDGAGIFGVELFLLVDGTILLNEIAPRPHNSGHYTIEACVTDQFQNHVRAVMGMPLGSCQLRVGAALMINVLGTGSSPLDERKSWLPCEAALKTNGAVHWYDKVGVSKKRKIGHITFTGNDYSELRQRYLAWRVELDALCEPLGCSSNDFIRQDPFLPRGTVPQVGIIMGSTSDLKTMQSAADILAQFGVPYELTVVSAHRTPKRMAEYASQARYKGIKVIIAGAGGAAHLPGMIAAHTPLPVIGVPVQLSVLDGVDSMYSILQMPRGVPVATVAINNSTNAGLLAVRILSAGQPELLDKIEMYLNSNEQLVQKQAAQLEETGHIE